MTLFICVIVMCRRGNTLTTSVWPCGIVACRRNLHESLHLNHVSLTVITCYLNCIIVVEGPIHIDHGLYDRFNLHSKKLRHCCSGLHAHSRHVCITVLTCPSNCVIVVLWLYVGFSETAVNICIIQDTFECIEWQRHSCCRIRVSGPQSNCFIPKFISTWF